MFICLMFIVNVCMRIDALFCHIIQIYHKRFLSFYPYTMYEQNTEKKVRFRRGICFTFYFVIFYIFFGQFNGRKIDSRIFHPHASSVPQFCWWKFTILKKINKNIKKAIIKLIELLQKQENDIKLELKSNRNLLGKQKIIFENFISFKLFALSL